MRAVAGTEKLVRYSIAAAERAKAHGAFEEALFIIERAIDAKGEESMDAEMVALHESLCSDYNPLQKNELIRSSKYSFCDWIHRVEMDFCVPTYPSFNNCFRYWH